MIDDIIKEARSKMKSTLSVYEDDLQGIRGNRASVGLVDRLLVNYYEQMTELRQLANISTPEPMQILIRPYDTGAVKTIERAIMEANIGVNPNVDGTSIRLNMPALTRERRRDLVKVLHNRTEEARIAIRNIRRSANEDFRDFEREKMISEDDQKYGEQEVQKLTDDYIKQIDELDKAKEKEILEV